MKLTDSHLVLLSAAAQHMNRLLTRPDRLSDKAASALAGKLIKAGLVETVPAHRNEPHWPVADAAGLVGLRITTEGLAALGLTEVDEEPAGEPAPPAEPQPAQAPRLGSKQGLVLDLLGREEGATLGDLIAVTGWLPHTTRAALTGLRKRGYALARSKGESGQTVYRIEAATSERAAVQGGA